MILMGDEVAQSKLGNNNTYCLDTEINWLDWSLFDRNKEYFRFVINNLAVILSLLFWTWMWGPMGAFLSSPLLIVGLILNQHLLPNGSG